MPLKDLGAGDEVATVLLVREARRRETKQGKPYLALKLADASETLEARVWSEGIEEIEPHAQSGAAVHVRGTLDADEKWGRQVKIESLWTAQDGEYSTAELTGSPLTDPGELEAELEGLIASVADEQLRALLNAVLGEHSETGKRFRTMAAAKVNHEAYAHGLLEHTLRVAKGVDALSGLFPGVDRDLAITGALLHDIGKTLTYTAGPLEIDMTDQGKLISEIPLGYYLVAREAERVDGISRERTRALLHIVLSHHGLREYGSPVVPLTREAELVHSVDNIAGRLGSYDRVERGLSDGESWSPYDRALGKSVYFG